MTGLLARFLLSPAGYWQRCRSLGLDGAFEHEVADKQVTGRDEGLSPEVDRTRLGARDWAARHELLLYFVLAYLISWALWPLVILNPTSSPLVGVWAIDCGSGGFPVGRRKKRTVGLGPTADPLASCIRSGTSSRCWVHLS